MIAINVYEKQYSQWLCEQSAAHALHAVIPSVAALWLVQMLLLGFTMSTAGMG